MPMKPNEIRNLGTDELKAKHAALMQELFNLSQHAKMGKLEKPDQIRQVKKDIARVLTVLRQKDIKI